MAEPAAGQPALYEVGGTYWERLVTVSFRLVAAGAAANRVARVTILDQDSRIVALHRAPFQIVATNTADFTFGVGLQQAGAVSAPSMNAPLASLFMQPGWSVAITADAIQAADQLSRVLIYRERFPTGPEGYPMGGFEPA